MGAHEQEIKRLREHIDLIKALAETPGDGIEPNRWLQVIATQAQMALDGVPFPTPRFDLVEIARVRELMAEYDAGKRA